ncbi:hypothetical protein M3936_16475 [Sutcliffiella horikoshii]|uniref:hypothetical protein n=1 Tax=Sutcliffiella horikoshii TaxID=79883 RepID=UPI00203D4188|nr:hypothetical protein [Sutcliffiella horikoshii]MCM3619186.1 hypothetical protein [Sutcliffiella horikoshii]
MELKIFKFGDDSCDWVCHETKEQAINFYKDTCGEECFQELVECYGDEAVTEEPMVKMFTYYHDGVTPDKDTIENHIKKYCHKPDFFATSEF